ncbi:efflux RND transporter permease subunit [bacterium]|nr:efflux RND transporter permease subunit [bacterium]
MAQNLFIRRPKFAIVISLVIVLAGLICLTGLPLEEYPSISPPQVVVSASYPGASADVIETTIAAPLEAKLNGVENMLYMTSSSQNGSYSLTIYFEVGTDPDMAVIHVQNRLQLATPRLPEMVRRYGVTVRKSTGGPGVLLISMSAKDNMYAPLYISNYASIYVKDELERVKGVSSATVFGSTDYAIRVWLDSRKMSSFDISVSDVNNAISTQNTQVPAGDIGIEPLQDKQMIKLTLRTQGRMTEVEQFQNIVIKSKPNGSVVRLKDIARVELGSESYSFKSTINNERVSVISVKQLSEANAIDVAKKLTKKMEELSKKFPPGMEYQIIRDETTFVLASIHEVVESIFIAILLVTMICYLFLGSMRASLVPFFAIPVSLIGTFIFISAFGFSINLLMLFGMVLAVGLVVDDAIVVLENVQRHIQNGVKPVEATDISMREVTSPVIATSLVLMAVFVPVCFMPGATGKMYQQFALCLAVSIGLSSIVALTLSPALCSLILKSKEEYKELEWLVKFDNWFNNMREKYLVGARYFIEHSKTVGIIFFTLIALALLLFKITPTSFLPEEDKGALFMQIQLPDGSSASRTDLIAEEVNNKIKDIKGIKQTNILVGFAGENTAFIVIMLEDWSERKRSAESARGITAEIRKRLANYNDAIIAVFSPPSIPGLGMFGGFEFQLLDRGNRTPQEMYEISKTLVAAAQQDSKLTGVYTQYTSDLPQLLVNIDYARAMIQNVDINEIYATLAAIFGTTYVNDFNKYGRVFRVLISGDEDYRGKQSDMDNVVVKNKSGYSTPLHNLVEYKSITGPYTITRYNMYQAVTINGSAAKGVSSGVAMNEMERLTKEVLPDDVGFEWSGISLQEKNSSGQVGLVLGLALLFVYLFLVALYESWTLPVAVMLISPIAIVGALFFQYIAGFSLDIYSQIGLVMLVGMSTKQAILIIEFAKEAKEKQGLSIEEAAMSAAKLRFRAVMMTSIAFILGVLPLVFASGAGAASRHSVGMTVCGGMITVAVAGVLLVPAIYVIIEKMNIYLDDKFAKFKSKRKN